MTELAVEVYCDTCDWERVIETAQSGLCLGGTAGSVAARHEGRCSGQVKNSWGPSR